MVLSSDVSFGFDVELDITTVGVVGAVRVFVSVFV